MAKNAPIRAVSLARIFTAPASRVAEDHAPLYLRLAGLGKKGSVAETMREWLKEGGVAERGELMNIVKQLRHHHQHHKYKHALKLIDWMVKRGMKSDGDIAVCLDLISKVKGIGAAESYFASLSEFTRNQETYEALLNSYCDGKMVNKAIALYEKMKGLSLTCSTMVHNKLMKFYMKVGEPKKVHTQFQEMKATNVSPNKFTYCILIESYASLNEINSAERVLKEVEEERQVVLPWTIYCNLAGHYNSAGLFDKAESALKVVEKIMKPHDRLPYHSLLSLYAATGNSAEVNRVWKLVKSKFVKTSNMSYFNMLQALGKLDDLDALKQCFEEWEHVHNNYDIRVVNVVIEVYLRKGMIEEAEALWKEAAKKGKGTDPWTLHIFIDYYLKACKIDLALKCLEIATYTVKQSEWKPGKKKVRAFLKYFEEAKDVDGAQAFCRILNKLNQSLDTEGYESLLRIYLAAGKKEPSLLQWIKEDGIKVSSEIEKLIERVCLCSNLREDHRL